MDGDGYNDIVGFAPNAQGVVVTLAKSTTIQSLTSYNGAVANGYIQGAEVFVDANFNLIRDDNEPFTTTNEQGKYQLLFNLANYDSNGNGI